MTPTLIVAHRRERAARAVAEAVLASCGAEDVWAWVDGPRSTAEHGQTSAVARLLSDMPWPGSFRLIENTRNHGVAQSVPKAVEWVLNERSDVVVLEDDCLATPEFFTFATEMLDNFRHDRRVAIVSGTRIAKPVASLAETPYSYSSFPLIWGWATWADRWERYRHDIRGWRRHLGVRELVRQGGPLHAWDWYRLFNSVATEHPWSWDYQLTYMMWRWQQLAVVPGVDLVENIGFGDMASHTSLEPPFAPRPADQVTRLALIEAVAKRNDVPVALDPLLDRELRRAVFSPSPLERLRSRLASLSRHQRAR